MLNLIRYVAESIAEAGLKGLAGMVPGGVFAVAVAEGVLKKLRSKPAAEVRQDVEGLAQATSDQTREAVEKTVREMLPAEVATKDDIVDLKQYLTQLPEQVRQSLRRAEDPSGKTVPAAFALTTPDQVLAMLPPRPPRFRSGMPVPGLDGWSLLKPLGVGGFGEVWFAQHDQMESLNGAVKFCFGDSAEALKHEAALIDRVMKAGDHPNIVRLRNARLTGETPWLLFDYVGGSGSTDWIHRFARMPAAERVEKGMKTLRQLAGAVAFFHALNPPVVHRDLKPSNILFDSAAKLFRITDFGIGSVTAQEVLQGAITTGGRLLTSLHGSHTPLYASPQQRAGGQPDPRDDVHALGVIGYQILTGQQTHGAGPDFADELRDAGAGDELVAVLRKCVAQNVEKRIASAVELKALLAALTPAPAPVPVPPPIAVVPPPPPPPEPPPAPSPVVDPPDVVEEFAGYRTAWVSNAAVKSWLEKRLDRRERWETAERAGSLRAAVLLAACHQYGVGMAVDPAEAMRLYRLAADGGVAEGMHMVGLFFEEGTGVAADAAEALKWYQTAAKAGNTLSMVFAGDLFREGVTADLPQALRCYHAAASAGYALGMERLGELFRDGLGVTQDYGEAMRWFQKAADGGDALGMRKLGHLYYHGHGVPQDYLQAMVWYRKAATLGHADAMYDLGHLFQHGEGMPANLDEAETWYERGAAAGSADAMWSLGDLYYYGIGRGKKYKPAMDWYRKAADAGSAYACHQLGEMCANAYGMDRKDYPQAVKWYTLGAERGDLPSALALADVLEDGKGVPVDLKAALLWYERAESMGDRKGRAGANRVRRLLKRQTNSVATEGTEMTQAEDATDSEPDLPTT